MKLINQKNLWNTGTVYYYYSYRELSDNHIFTFFYGLLNFTQNEIKMWKGFLLLPNTLLMFIIWNLKIEHYNLQKGSSSSGSSFIVMNYIIQAGDRFMLFHFQHLIRKTNAQCASLELML